jgi:hypothetical protein
MSNRFSKAIVFAITVLFVMAPLAVAQTFGTEITEQPGAVSPGSPTEKPGGITGQSEPGIGSQSNMPGGRLPMTEPSGTGSPGVGGTKGMGR